MAPGCDLSGQTYLANNAAVLSALTLAALAYLVGLLQGWHLQRRSFTAFASIPPIALSALESAYA